MSSPQQLPATMMMTTSSTSTTTSRRTIMTSTSTTTTATPARMNHMSSSSAGTSKTSASSAAADVTDIVSLQLPPSSWKRFNLHFVLLTSLLCMAVWNSILQSSAGIFVVTPPPMTPTTPTPPSTIFEKNDGVDSSHSINHIGLLSTTQQQQQQQSEEEPTQSQQQQEPSQPQSQYESQKRKPPPSQLLRQEPEDTTQSSSAASVEETASNAKKGGVISANETTTKISASPFASLEPIARGTAQVRRPVVNDTTTTTNIPRIIWMFWDTGWPAKNHPGANMNRRSWELANPTFTVHALDGPTVERLTNRSLHVPDERWQILHVQAKSDVYRTLLLQKYGGIWADCNVFCNRPVQDWVDLNSTDVVSFRRTDNLSEQVKKGIQPWITSWFLAAPPASYTMTKVTSVISDPDEHYRFRAQYFWWHHIVAQIANTDNRVNDLIQSYTPPWTCSGKDWQSQATALKRCANKIMPPIIYTTEQCCPAIGGRPHMSDVQNNAELTTDSLKQQQELMMKELCSQWNCTVQAVNLGRGNAIRKLWGSELIRTLNDDYFDP